MKLPNVFSQLKRYLGLYCLEYALNEEGLSKVDRPEHTGFSAEQEFVLRELHRHLKAVRIELIQGDEHEGRCIESLLDRQINRKPLLQHFRGHCGGQAATFKPSGDSLLDSVLEIAARQYPSMLTLCTGAFNINDYNFQSVLPLDAEVLERVVASDSVSNLSNGKKGWESALKFATDDDLSHQVQMTHLAKFIVTVSFQNCTFRNRFGFDDLVKEITRQIAYLRDVAGGGEATYSSFIGIVGLNLQGFDAIELGSLTVRQFRDANSPNTLAKRALSNRSEGGSVSPYGCIAEISHSTRRAEEGPDYTCSSSKKNYEYIHKYQEAFKLALIFTTFEVKGFNFVFTTLGIGTVPTGNYSYSVDSLPKGYITLNKELLPDLQRWYDLLLNKELKQVALPLRKIQQAIFERSDPVDSFIDAFMALEGMFGSRGEVLFKVSTSISRLLHDDYEGRLSTKRIFKELYGKRSDVVHGNANGKWTSEEIEQAAKETIELALKCLTKLLEDDTLLSLQPHERTNHIVYND